MLRTVLPSWSLSASKQSVLVVGLVGLHMLPTLLYCHLNRSIRKIEKMHKLSLLCLYLLPQRLTAGGIQRWSIWCRMQRTTSLQNPAFHPVLPLLDKVTPNHVTPPPPWLSSCHLQHVDGSSVAADFLYSQPLSIAWLTWIQDDSAYRRYSSH